MAAILAETAQEPALGVSVLASKDSSSAAYRPNLPVECQVTAGTCPSGVGISTAPRRPVRTRYS
jgi:hypothetical protein